MENYANAERINMIRKRQIEEAKTQQQVYDELRNDVIEEIAKEIEKLKGFGNDTINSFAIYIREMKIDKPHYLVLVNDRCWRL
jgi:hypothetical protein